MNRYQSFSNRIKPLRELLVEYVSKSKRNETENLEKLKSEFFKIFDELEGPADNFHHIKKIRDKIVRDMGNNTFDEGYFEDENRSELYVYLAAEKDKDVFSWLEYAWNLTHDEDLSDNILHREIYLLKEQGVTFNSMHQRDFKTNAGNFYDINHISIKELENGKVEVEFVIEYDRYKSFFAILDKNEAYQMAISFPVPKKFDELYILAEPHVKDQVSEWIDFTE